MNTKGGLTKKTNQIQEVQQKDTTLKGLIKAMEPEIRKALPSMITPERFTRMVFTALSSTPKLQQCTPQSFLGAMMQAAQLGLEPNTPVGQAYLIPYGNVCQFQLGYKGLLDLAYRSGEIKDIQAHEVHENDEFEYELGLDPKLEHIPAMSNRGPVTMYYAVWHTKTGGYGFEVMSKDDVLEFAQKKSKSFRNGPWQTDFDEMAKKTVLKKALKYAPIATEFVKSIATDETVKSSILPDMADQPNEMEYADIEVEEPEEKQAETTIAPDAPFTPEELGDGAFDA